MSNSLYAQDTYRISPDPKQPGGWITKGLITPYLLLNDARYAWFKTGQESYQPTTDQLNVLEAVRDRVKLVIFGGTWCDDTQYILPRFFKWASLCGLPDEAISLFGVDRDKKTIGNISEAFDITHVPTIIVMKDGKELGRVVEYGTTGKWDLELLELFRSVK